MTLPTKYDQFRNSPVYQIDFESTNKGRRVAATKRRVKWSFGFSHLPAVQQGLSGTDCRGEEHEVVLVMSLTSGKQRVLADGTEVHFARAPVTDKMECTWKMNSGHEIKVIAHPAPFLKQQPGFRQFDLQIDGQSYWDMPKVFQLGKGNKRSAAAGGRTRALSQKDLLPTSNASLPALEAPMPPRRVQSMPKMDHIADLIGLSTPFEGAQNPFAPVMVSPVSASNMQYEFAPIFHEQAHQTMRSYSSQQLSIQTMWPVQQEQFAVISPDSSVHSRSESPMEQALNSLVDFDNISPVGLCRPMAQPATASLAALQASKAQQPTREIMRSYVCNPPAPHTGFQQQQQPIW
jgi:hypothetical protein